MFFLGEDASSQGGAYDPLGSGYLGSTIFLGIADFVLFSVAAYQTIYFFRSTNGEKLKLLAKKIFYMLIMFVMLNRSMFFLLWTVLIKNSEGVMLQFFIFWNRSIETLFFAAYFLLLLFWMEFVWGLRQKQYIYLKPDSGFFAKNSVVITSCLLVVFGSIPLNFLLLWFWHGTDGERLNSIDKAFAWLISCFFLVAAAGYLITGIMVLVYVQRMPLAKTRKQATRVGIIAAAVTACFLTKVVIEVYALVNYTSTKGYDVTWWWHCHFSP